MYPIYYTYTSTLYTAYLSIAIWTFPKHTSYPLYQLIFILPIFQSLFKNDGMDFWDFFS